jgi:micrococcal nuclease
MYEYAAQVTRVVDGDTVHARVDLGCDVRIDLTLRLYGIDTPELPTAEGKAARDYLAGRLTEVGGRVTIKTEKDRREKYGRYLATLLVGAENLNRTLVDLGHARVYLP